MAKIVVDCKDPNDIEEIEATLDQIVGRCDVTRYRQAQKMVDIGTANSLNDAAKKMAEEEEESKRKIETQIYRGKKKVPHVAEDKSNLDNSDSCTNLNKLEKSKHGGKRDGAGRPKKDRSQEKFLDSIAKRIKRINDDMYKYGLFPAEVPDVFIRMIDQEYRNLGILISELKTERQKMDAHKIIQKLRGKGKL